MTWQGLNPVDDDADGFADTLPAGGSVRLERYFAGGGLPPRFRAETTPLLRYLDRAGLRYNLTTDVALARGEELSVARTPGIVFAGSELWLPEQLERRLRDYVVDGGRVASFGSDAFRRTVTLGERFLHAPSRRRPEDAFGERAEMLRTSRAPLDVLEDDVGLFAGLTDFIGEFTEFEVSRGLARDTTRVAAAGRETDEPAFVAYSLGDGLVIRTGTPQWARELDQSRLSLEVQQVTDRIWRLLSGGGL
jgi:hypothetical protein